MKHIGKFETILSPVRYTPAGQNDVITVQDSSDVIGTFLDLTAFTVPHGNELRMYDETLQSLGFVRNERGNYWHTVGDGKSKTLFVAHLDTADQGVPKRIFHVSEDDYVKTDGTTLLGADDRAGLTVLLYMIHKGVPGDYLLTIGEERGCLGAGEEAPHIPQNRYDRAIQFDRSGVDEVITHQLGRRTASREFARSLCKEFRKHSDGVLRLFPSNLGVYTDTNEFTGVIKECTNIAIGYTGAHTAGEVQDISYLLTIAEAACSVNWETLPTRNNLQPVNKHRRTFSMSGLKDFEPSLFDEDDDYMEIAGTNIWEMWSHIDSGKWTNQQLSRWVTYNPHKAAQMLSHYIVRHSQSSLDAITLMEGS